MKRWLISGVLLAGLLALAACAGEKESPATPAPTAGVAGPPGWDEIVAAAKKEGKLALAGPLGDEVRKALVDPFEKKYGISIEYMAQSGSEFVPRLKAERDAGQYLWDVYVGGTSTPITQFKPMGALDPLEPALMLPEVKDPKGWRDGKLPLVDKDRQVLGMLTYATEAFYYNPTLVKPGEIKSYKDLLDPKWTGKIALFDPSIPGSGDAKFTFLYVQPDLGPDFIRALVKQISFVSRDYDQLMRGVAEGKFAFSLGGHKNVSGPMKKAGAPIDILPASQIKEGGSLHVGVGALALFNRAPHPNAAKLYINWLLSKEGQAGYTVGADLPSNRVDTPTDHLETWELPKPGYIALDGEDTVVNVRTKVRDFAREVLAGR